MQSWLGCVGVGRILRLNDTAREKKIREKKSREREREKRNGMFGSGMLGATIAPSP